MERDRRQGRPDGVSKKEDRALQKEQAKPKESGRGGKTILFTDEQKARLKEIQEMVNKERLRIKLGMRPEEFRLKGRNWKKILKKLGML